METNSIKEIRDLLPIGSVVLLEEAEKKLMIFGVIQTESDQLDGSAKQYDYLGVVYPEGNLGPDFQYFFNHKDIKEVFFRGYENAERAEFIERLAEFYEQEGQGVLEQQPAQESE